MSDSSRRKTISYSIKTRLVREADEYAVYDEIQYDADQPPSLVCRIRGPYAACAAYAERLDSYWKDRLSEEPPAAEPIRASAVTLVKGHPERTLDPSAEAAEEDGCARADRVVPSPN